MSVTKQALTVSQCDALDLVAKVGNVGVFVIDRRTSFALYRRGLLDFHQHTVDYSRSYWTLSPKGRKFVDERAR